MPPRRKLNLKRKSVAPPYSSRFARTRRVRSYIRRGLVGARSRARRTIARRRLHTTRMRSWNRLSPSQRATLIQLFTRIAQSRRRR